MCCWGKKLLLKKQRENRLRAFYGFMLFTAIRIFRRGQIHEMEICYHAIFWVVINRCLVINEIETEFKILYLKNLKKI